VDVGRHRALRSDDSWGEVTAGIPRHRIKFILS
jgi:hypothetical protein